MATTCSSARFSRVHAELSELRPDADADAPPPLAPDRLAPVRYGFAERYRDTMLALLALEALDSARPLRPGSLAGAALPTLTPDEVAVVERLGDMLEASLVRLVQSRRPDWGFPLLLGMARLIALDEARRSERWVVLDATPADAIVIRRERLVSQPAFARRLRERVEADFGSARAALLRRGAVAEAFPEAELAELEVTGNRLAQVEGAFADGRDARLVWGAPLPGRSVHLPALRLPALGSDDLQRRPHGRGGARGGAARRPQAPVRLQSLHPELRHRDLPDDRGRAAARPLDP